MPTNNLTHLLWALGGNSDALRHTWNMNIGPYAEQRLHRGHRRRSSSPSSLWREDFCEAPFAGSHIPQQQ